MSEYYKANRGEAWNYGGKNWKLSRSKIDLFLECPRCLWKMEIRVRALPQVYYLCKNTAGIL